ncbi:MAG TPA: hypothetical protein VFQ35_12180, partial [Polyangiaceae bacterium]|nr:hypothetical protein [Polyangiaceae bacterium]
QDYRLALGLVPGLESGVPFYDAFSSYERADVEAAPGTDVLRRANMVQRGLQSWTRTYVLKQAYKVLFDRDLDEEDPTRVPSSTPFRRRTVGDEVKEFLESRLPERLASETGGHDLVAWVEWLMKNGEIGLDGRPVGTNTYAEMVAGYERRLTDYQARIEAGEARGKNVRAERQRMLDVQREYGSFKSRVEALRGAAQESSSLYAKASRDYSEALWQSAAWFAAILACWGVAHSFGGRLPPTRRFARWLLPVAFVVVPLALVVVPFWVLANPARAAQVAGRPLRAVRLLDFEAGEQPVTRGAAAQLEKTRPWTLLKSAAQWRLP